MADKITVTEENGEEFRRLLRKAKDSAGDLRVVFGLIARSAFKFNRTIFQLRGPGKYADLSPDYKKWKSKKQGGTPYPILFLSGRLALSMLQPGGENVLQISKDKMFFGTSVPYAEHLQFGTSKMPARPPFFVDFQRQRAWSQIVRAHLKKNLVDPKGA